MRNLSLDLKIGESPRSGGLGLINLCVFVSVFFWASGETNEPERPLEWEGTCSSVFCFFGWTIDQIFSLNGNVLGWHDVKANC